jgi:hypothetical protein
MIPINPYFCVFKVVMSKVATFKNVYVQCDVMASMGANNNVMLRIDGKVMNPMSYQKMEVYAPCPIDRMMNYSGSGLPFPCAAVAFDNTPNYAVIPVDGNFTVNFKYPNSYYTSDFKTKVASSIFVKLQSVGSAEPIDVRFELPDKLFLHTLGYRTMRKGPLYYSVKEDLLPIAGAEATMRNYSAAKVQYNLA